MRFILLTILSTIIIFFVWNILKRMFFKSFYQFPTSNPSSTPKNNPTIKDKKMNWDAETVEYEEIKEGQKQ